MMNTWNSLSYINLENLRNIVNISYPNLGDTFEDNPFSKILSIEYSLSHEDDSVRRTIHPYNKKYDGSSFLAKVTKQLFLIPLEFIEQCLDEQINLDKIDNKEFQEELKDILLIKLKSLSYNWIDEIIKKSELHKDIILSVYIISDKNSVFIFDLSNKIVNPIIKKFVEFTGVFSLDNKDTKTFLDFIIGKKEFRPFIYFQEYIDLNKISEVLHV